jgi:hypothetical protein
MMQPVSVDGIFWADGTLRVRRIRLDQEWVSVGQGRQWTDDDGHHVLIMLYGEEVREMLLAPGALVWQLKAKGSPETGIA